MTTHARQPFAALDGARLMNLTSIKNRQNAISTLSSPGKSSINTLTSPTKRRYSPAAFEDDFDAENIDPSIFNSPTKRSKKTDGTPLKPSSKFILTDSFTSSKPAAVLFPTPCDAEKRKTSLSVSLPTTSNNTPISRSRGSPKHKRIGLLSKRRASSSPFRRVDPPLFMGSNASTSLPFSIDAALSGTISTYTPKAVSTIEESMPNSWFFDIHEDTPEEEAANLMEHSALCLDISSDDDEETKRLNVEKEKGKENVPPPDFVSNASQSRSSHSASSPLDISHCDTKIRRSAKRFADMDAMVEDRKALGNLDAADFYPEGLDASSVIVALDEADENHVQPKPSGLVHETKLDAVEVEPVSVAADEGAVIQDETVMENKVDIAPHPNHAQVEIWVDDSITPDEASAEDIIT